MSFHTDTRSTHFTTFAKAHEGGNATSRLFLGLIRSWKKRRMIAAFDRLDDRILADIGLSRGDIPNVIEGLEPGGLRHSADAGALGRSAPTRRLRQFA